MGNAPALRDVEVEQFRQFCCSLPGDGVLPCSKGNQQIPVLVKGQIAVHHGADAHGGNAFPVFHAGQGRFQPCPDLIQIISPDSVFIGTLPGVITGRNRNMLFVDGNRLDPGGAKLDAQVSIFHHHQPHGFSVGYGKVFGWL